MASFNTFTLYRFAGRSDATDLLSIYKKTVYYSRLMGVSAKYNCLHATDINPC